LHLASLTLYNFVIEPAIVDTDMMVFILRHKGMRAQLALHGYHHCPSKHQLYPHTQSAIQIPNQYICPETDVGDSGHAMPP
jgi:hypothetical protein